MKRIYCKSSYLARYFKNFSSAYKHFLFKNIYFATSWTLPPREASSLLPPPATLLVTTVSNLDDENYTNPISWFEQMFCAPPALVMLHNATVIQLHYQVVLFVTLALTSDLESDNYTHEGALTLTRVGGSVVGVLFDVCRSDWEKTWRS